MSKVSNKHLTLIEGEKDIRQEEKKRTTEHHSIGQVHILPGLDKKKISSNLTRILGCLYLHDCLYRSETHPRSLRIHHLFMRNNKYFQI